jgi:hypothetical protein
LPAVVETFPLVDGEPFPTLYWLTCARARREIGSLESTGMMRELNARLEADEDFARRLADAQRDYIARRDAREPIRAGGVGGGPLDRIKCLHAHYAHHLVCGCNPVGEAVEERTGEMLRPPPCVDVT